MTLIFDATDDDLVLFLEEASEQLETLSSGLLQMERAGADAQLLQAVFRAAHTLKGSSATIAHHRMANLTHAMESVLDNLRNGKLAVTTALIDALLACVDALADLNHEVETHEAGDTNVEGLVAQLREVAEGAPGGAPAAPAPAPVPTPAPTANAAPPTAAPIVAEAAVELPELTEDERRALALTPQFDGHRAVLVTVTIDEQSEWPAVRAYQALMEFAPLGGIIRSWPGEEELQSGEGGHTLRVLLATDRDTAVIDRAARAVSEVAAVTVAAVPTVSPAPTAAARGPVAPPPAPVTPPVEADPTPPAAPTPAPVAMAPAPPAAPAVEASSTPAAPPAEARPAAREEATPAASNRTAAARMVKVDIARLDNLMNLVGELVIDRGRLVQVMRQLSDRFGNDNALEGLTDITQHLSRISDELQEQVMMSRLLPVESVFNRFPRMVRDLANRTNKKVRFVVEGEDTGLDRSVIDEIGDPLLHLIRNGVDHGIEPPSERIDAGKPEEATLRLAARQEENSIIIEVQDDGRGIAPDKLRAAVVKKGLLSAEAAGRLSDEEAINLIFMPGFSSAEQVTDVSGRGVGMDIVRTNIEKINGSITVSTAVGVGTTFTIKLPLTLAIIRGLLVRCGEAAFTIPLTSVQETLRIETNAIHTVQGRQVVLVRGQTLPLVRLSDVFAHPGQVVERDLGPLAYVVAARSGRATLGLIVDGLIGEQEVVIKTIGQALGEIDGIAGATILGDGSVSMIIDVPKVVERLAVQTPLAGVA